MSTNMEPTEAELSTLSDIAYEVEGYQDRLKAAIPILRQHVAAEVAKETEQLNVRLRDQGERLAAACAEAAQLRKDAERLDWLDSYGTERDAVFEEGDPDVGCPSAWQIWSRNHAGAPRKMIQYAPSLRAAINSSMEASK